MLELYQVDGGNQHMSNIKLKVKTNTFKKKRKIYFSKPRTNQFLVTFTTIAYTLKSNFKSKFKGGILGRLFRGPLKKPHLRKKT
uniref:Uncharacterized protein n=1 Tax=Timema tahoe TaxID=61484 RepID=A0A7R9FLF9_9NEOP|nr:unnamed protein product [Timema tahoe]